MAIAQLFQAGGGIIGGLIGLGAFFLRSMIKVMPSDKILVVTGRKTVRGPKEFGFSVERGRTVKIPYFQAVKTLDLGVFPINVRVEGVNSANGITVGADATAGVCIDDDDEAMLYSAVERLMGKDRKQIQGQIQATLVGNFRGALNKATPLQAIGMEESWREEGVEAKTPTTQEQGERAMFRNELLRDINSDLSSFGMKVVSVSLQKIWDTSNYIANLAQKTLAKKRQDVEIEEARLRAIAEQAESDSQRRVEVAVNQANEKILTTKQKVEVFRRECQGQIEKTRLSADNGIAEAENRGQRDVQEQLVQLQKLQNLSNVTLEADAREKAARVLGAGEQEAVGIREQTRNDILEQKVKMLAEAGPVGKAVLFIQQQLPNLFESFREHATGQDVDSLVVMDDKKGLGGAVNRGPGALVDFLQFFNEALGVDVRSFVSPGDSRPAEEEAPR
jgi:flotillin